MSNISKNVKDVLEGRMYHDFENVDEVRELLECIQNNFNYKWLYGNKNHPFVKLWQRGDHFALVELLNLGNSIKNLIRNNNQEWLNQKIKGITCNDYNNSRADYFELLIAGSLISDFYITKPMPKGNKGFDIQLVYNDAQINLSLKNLKSTNFYNKFKEFSEKISKFIYDYIYTKVKFSYECMIIFDEYPDVGFDNLKTKISEYIVKSISQIDFQHPKLIISDKDNKFCICIKIFFGNNIDNNISHYFNCFCKMHKNEYANIVSKIDDAIANIATYTKKDASNINNLLIRLNTEVKIDEVSKCVKKLNFRNVDAIYLYQPQITRETDNSSTHFITFIRALLNTNLNDERQKLINSHKIAMKMYCGEFSDGQADKLVKFDSKTINFDDYYCFSSGEEVNRATFDGTSQIGTLNNLGDGINQVSVFNINGQSFAIRRKDVVHDEYTYF